MRLTEEELTEMLDAMTDLDFGPEIEIETESDDYDGIGDNELYAGQSGLPLGEDFHCEDDGQPTEYEEWQDFNGGDDWDQGQYDCMDY